MAIALAVALFMPGGSGRQRLAWIAFAIMGLAVFRSLSLGAWLGIAASSLVLSGLRGRRALIVTAASLALLTIVALALLPGARPPSAVCTSGYTHGSRGGR